MVIFQDLPKSPIYRVTVDSRGVLGYAKNIILKDSSICFQIDSPNRRLVDIDMMGSICVPWEKDFRWILTFRRVTREFVTQSNKQFTLSVTADRYERDMMHRGENFAMCLGITEYRIADRGEIISDSRWSIPTKQESTIQENRLAYI